MAKQKVDIREYVKEKYSEIAQQSKTANEGSCCGATASDGVVDYTVFSDDYSDQEGYFEDADLGLGCGIPTEGATIREGDTVLDLGSGAGNDCFIARQMTGQGGKVIGIDFSKEMVEKALANRDKLGYQNIEFHEGDIESMPLSTATVDVILSNCVLNLVPEKGKAFSEMNRVLKKGGHFSVSDVVIRGALPENMVNEAALYAGCVSGALQQADYLHHIEKAGFESINVVKKKAIHIPESILNQYLDSEEIARFKSGDIGVYSITVNGKKPE